MAKRKDSPGQVVLDFSDRGIQLRVLRHAILPTTNGVAGHRLKDVLRVVDDHCGKRESCWMSYATIAREAQMSVRQARRAVKTLEGMFVLNVQRRAIPAADPTRATCNHYVITWGNLIELVDAQYQVAMARRSSGHGAPIKWPSDGHQSDRKRIEAPPPVAIGRGSRNPWQAVEEEFSDSIDAIPALIREAKRRKLGPRVIADRLREGIAVQALPENASKFTTPRGALYRFALDGQWPVIGVVTIEQHRAAAALNDALALSRQAAVEAAAARDRASLAKYEALDAEYGPALDAMTPEERGALANNEMMRTQFQKCRADSRLYRPAMLNLMWEREHGIHQLATA